MMAACKELTANLVHDFLSSIDTILCDCDGVLWGHDTALPGAAETLTKMRRLGKRIFFVTNNSIYSSYQVLQKLQNLGFEAYLEEIVCPAFTAASYLKYCLKFTGKVYLVGSKGMADELDLMDIQYVGEGPDPATSLDIDEWKALSIDKEVKAVLVGFDEHFSYIKLIKASTYLSDPGCVFIATNQDEKFPVTGDIVIPDVGVLVSAVGTAVQRQPVVVGKRGEYLFQSIMNSCNGINPQKTVVIGDQLSSDILMGRRNGLKTLLVETGLNKRSDAMENMQSKSTERQKMVPDYFISSLAELGKEL